MSMPITFPNSSPSSIDFLGYIYKFLFTPFKGTVFFFLGKDCGHSLTQFQKNLYFFFRTPGKKIQLYFFFPEKRLHFTHSLVSNLCIFFVRHRKKNTVFLLTHSILDENVTKVIFSRNKKKYGTFDVTTPYFADRDSKRE